MEGPAYLCKTDEVGEICVGSASGGSYYWGLKGMSNSTFRVQPLLTSGDPMGETEFIRSGLLGFLGPVSRFTRPYPLLPNLADYNRRAFN